MPSLTSTTGQHDRPARDSETGHGEAVTIPVSGAMVTVRMDQTSPTGNPSGWVPLSDGSSIEIACEREGHAPARSYSFAHHCSEEAFESGDHGDIMGVTHMEGHDSLADLADAIGRYLSRNNIQPELPDEGDGPIEVSIPKTREALTESIAALIDSGLQVHDASTQTLYTANANGTVEEHRETSPHPLAYSVGVWVHPDDVTLDEWPTALDAARDIVDGFLSNQSPSDHAPLFISMTDVGRAMCRCPISYLAIDCIHKDQILASGADGRPCVSVARELESHAPMRESQAPAPIRRTEER